MRIWAARIGGTVGAGAWLIGLPLIAYAGVIPSDSEYFLSGAVGTILGCCVVPVALMPFLEGRHEWWLSAVRWVGAALGVLLAALSTLVVLGSVGDLGARAPAWVLDAAALAISIISRRTLGPALVWPAAVFSASVVVLVLLSATVPVVTDSTLLLTVLPSAALWLGPAIWLLVRVWCATGARLGVGEASA
jgi:hypothetical protein